MLTNLFSIQLMTLVTVLGDRQEMPIPPLGRLPFCAIMAPGTLAATFSRKCTLARSKWRFARAEPEDPLLTAAACRRNKERRKLRVKVRTKTTT